MSTFVMNDTPSQVVKNLTIQLNALVVDVAAILTALGASTITGYTAPTQTSVAVTVHPPTTSL